MECESVDFDPAATLEEAVNFWQRALELPTAPSVAYHDGLRKPGN